MSFIAQLQPVTTHAFLYERLAAALQAMDYATALDCQIEVDDLERELRGLERQYGTRPIRRAVASDGSVISSRSRSSRRTSYSGRIDVL